MKKAAVALTLLLTALAGAVGGAGLYSGYPEVFGIHFVTAEGWRMSVGLLPGAAGETPSVALSLDLVLAAGTIYSDGGETLDLAYYAGAGGTASLLRPNPEINGHAMLGLEAYFTALKSAGFFTELQLGQRFGLVPVETGPFLGFRAGLTLR
jgi:hypothetical protein